VRLRLSKSHGYVARSLTISKQISDGCVALYVADMTNLSDALGQTSIPVPSDESSFDDLLPESDAIVDVADGSSQIGQSSAVTALIEQLSQDPVDAPDALLKLGERVIGAIAEHTKGVTASVDSYNSVGEPMVIKIVGGQIPEFAVKISTVGNLRFDRLARHVALHRALISFFKSPTIDLAFDLDGAVLGETVAGASQIHLHRSVVSTGLRDRKIDFERLGDSWMTSLDANDWARGIHVHEFIHAYGLAMPERFNEIADRCVTGIRPLVPLWQPGELVGLAALDDLLTYPQVCGAVQIELGYHGLESAQEFLADAMAKWWLATQPPLDASVRRSANGPDPLARIVARSIFGS
jgi:hypothetical protein